MKEWKRSDPSKNDRRKPSDKSASGLFAGATGESSCSNDGTNKCPVHQSTNHTLQVCKKFERMSTSEKKKLLWTKTDSA